MAIKIGFVLMCGFAAVSAACTGKSVGTAKTDTSLPAAQTQQGASPERQALFGDLHLHTTMSMDAYHWWGTTTTPEEAYRFARGEEITFMGRRLQRRQPLDFMAVTDHSENIGAGLEMQDPDSALAKSEIGQRFLATPRQGRRQAYNELRREEEAGTIPGFEVKAVNQSAWKRTIDAANSYYSPGTFTTFIGYEWTSSVSGAGPIHRNVIFRGATAPFPFTGRDSNRPEDLWTYLEENRRRGIEGLVIPHNGNMSNGVMYDWMDSDGRPIDETYAQRRLFNEPVNEISQVKGQSETHPILSPNDEFANFELYDIVFSLAPSKPAGSYIRDAYGRGLILSERIGTNPYKVGVVGSTDNHSGLSHTSEDSVSGTKFLHGEALDPDEARKALGIVQPDITIVRDYQTGSGGLAGVWAEQNTREAIYDALRRKETFATSGSRIKVRFFGGWNYPRDLVAQTNWVTKAYEGGVPMGGDLPSRAAGSGPPRFVIWALKDPDAANLDRAQVVKVWAKSGSYSEKVFDVALSGGRRPDPKTGKAPAVGNTVDLRTAKFTNMSPVM